MEIIRKMKERFEKREGKLKEIEKQLDNLYQKALEITEKGFEKEKEVVK